VVNRHLPDPKLAADPDAALPDLTGLLDIETADVAPGLSRHIEDALRVASDD
jgi:hypothetical protein